MSLIDSITNIANEFIKKPKYVRININSLADLSDKMISSGKEDFSTKIKNTEEVNLLDEIKLELLASSVNYCYWYGRADIRPNSSSSTLLYTIIVNEYNRNNRKIDARLIYEITKQFIEFRLPLIEDRAIHLEEAFYFGEDNAEEILNNTDDLEGMFHLLVTELPGFASDIFLKRACLFFMQLYRKLGWFSSDIYKLPIPADYHIPNLLRHYGVLEYSDVLSTHIETSYLIPKGSLMECEIRANAIIACRILSNKLDWLDTDVDTWLYLKREEVDKPFHLTITTDY